MNVFFHLKSLILYLNMFEHILYMKSG